MCRSAPEHRRDGTDAARLPLIAAVCRCTRPDCAVGRRVDSRPMTLPRENSFAPRLSLGGPPFVSLETTTLSRHAGA